MLERLFANAEYANEQPRWRWPNWPWRLPNLTPVDSRMPEPVSLRETSAGCVGFDTYRYGSVTAHGFE
jgi:hypothetical protein